VVYSIEGRMAFRPSSVTHSPSSASAKLNATPTSPEDLSAIYAFLNTQRE
jgi:hypothetical protein